MLRRIVSNSVELVKFISELGLKLSRPQAAHVLNMADALLVSDEHKTVASLNRQLVDAKDDSSVVHSFRESPWQAQDIRGKVLVFLVRKSIALARRLGLEKVVSISIDDALLEKDSETRHLEGVDWHHDHNASSKKQAQYKNGSVFVICHLKIGFISFAINWRLYVREQTVRRINRQRSKAQRLKYQSKYRLARAMLAEIAPLLPADFQVYVLFDSWYSSAKLIRYCRRQDWHVIAGLKSNRCIDGKQVRQWNKDCKRSGGYRARALSAGYRPIWEQGRRRLAPVSSLTGFSEIVEHIALLLSQGGNDSHDAFDKTTSGVTLGSEARIAPQHTRTDLPFTWIVGRLDASDAHEGPQGGFTLENVTASSSGFVVFAGGALAEQLTDFLCNGLHLILEGSPAQCSSAHLMPAGKHQLGLNPG